MRIPKMPYKYILNSFRSQYGYLKKFGLQIEGVGDPLIESDKISVSHPLIFDNRLLPETFMGLTVRGSINGSDLPEEFKIIDQQKEYIWAYQRFEQFVDDHFDEIRIKLGNPELTRIEMLDALCFGNFENHKKQCIDSEAKGKIPVWKKGTH